MRLNYIQIEGYKSFQFPIRVNFPVGEDGRSIFLVGGMNGAGKTTLMEALNLCFYGTKNLNELYKCINHKELAKGNAFICVEVEFETDQMESILVRRQWSATAIDNPQPKDLEEKLTVIKDGRRVSVQNKEMWQNFINSTIPQSISKFFFFDGEKIQEIANDDHSEVTLQRSMEEALGIEYITQLAQDMLYLKNDERKNFIEISDTDIQCKELEFKREQERKKRLQDDVEDYENELQNFKEEKEEAQKKFRSIFNIDPETAEATKEKEKKRIQLSNASAQLDNRIKSVIKDQLPWALAGSLFEPLKKQIDAELAAGSDSALQANAQSFANDVIIAFNTPQPVTDHQLTNEQKVEFSRRIVEMIRKKANVSNIETVLNLSDRDAAKVLNRMETVEESEIFSLHELLQEKDEVDAQIKAFEQSMRLGAGSQNERELFDDLQNTIENCQTQIGRISVNLSNKKEELISCEDKIKQIEQELSRLYDSHSTSKSKGRFIEECEAIANMLNDYKLQLRKQKINQLQQKTFEMFSMLSSKTGLIKSISIDSKTYEIVIRDRQDLEIKKSKLSAGEKEVFALSLLWGLAQTSQLNLPIVIDTPLSRLDSVHRDNIISKYFPNASHQVIILSTDTEIDQNYFGQLQKNLTGAARLEFNKTNELTTLKEGYFWEN